MKKTFDYEQSIWGAQTASVRISDPTAFRLREANRFVADLNDGARVLEVGSGAGQFIRAIKKIHPSLNCYGSDISVNALNAARSTNDGVVYVEQQQNQLPFEQDYFDAVLIFDVLEHVENPPQFLQEVRRVLKRGGIVYAFVPCEGDSLSMWHWLDRLGLKKNITKRFAGHIQYFSRSSLSSLFVDSGFNISSIRYSEHFFGQLLGLAAFCLMSYSAKKNNFKQINNEQYFTNFKRRGFGAVLRALVNGVVFVESVLFARLPSPNVHLVAIKPS